MSDHIDGGRLRAFIERIERLEEEIRRLNDDKSEVYKEAKGTGYDAKIIRKVVAARRKDAGELAEEETLFDLYMQAVESVPSRVHAREAA